MKITSYKREGGLSIVHMLLAILFAAVMAGIIFLGNRNAYLEREKNRAVCQSQLLKIEVAKLRYAVNQKLTLTNAIGEQEIFGTFNMRPRCPSGGDHGIGMTVGENPSCTVPNHKIE